MVTSLVRQTLHYFARPHKGVPAEPFDSPAAWRGAAVRDADDWRIDLTPAEVDELHAAVTHSDKPLAEMTAADLPLPTLSARIAEWRDVLAHGRGFVLLRGVPVHAWSEAQRERFFWGFGLHLGRPGAQNPDGDLLGHVRDQGFSDQTEVRAYRTNTEIRYHCDAADVVGLLCLTRAEEGGVSRIASSVTVFLELLKQRPDLAPLLFEPWLLDTKAEGGVRYFPVRPCRFAGGRLYSFYHADYYRSVSRHPDVDALDPRRLELLDHYDQIASDPQICLEMDLHPGDVQLLCNHTQIHARTGYTDGPTKRHLLRLWLSLDDLHPANHGLKVRLSWLGLAATLASQRLRQGAR